MGIFDKNIHMNGAGTSYQAFLDLADAAAKNDGTIGNRTVRLVKDGDGLATTTFNGIKGDRVSQIANAREAFLTSIAREFGYAARSIAEKALGEGAGREAVPLTARTIRAVNQALGDKGALAAESALVRECKMEFDIAVGFVRTQLEDRMGVTKSELDRGKIQAEALKLIREGKFPNNKDGLKAAVRELAAPRVALAARLETLLCKHGAPGHLVGRLAATALDEAMAIVDDTKIPDGDAFLDKLDELAQKCLANGHDLFEREGIAEGAVFDANKLVTTIFGPNALAEEDAMKAIDELKTKIEGFKEENISLEAFRAKCDRALDLTVKTYVMRQLGIEMMLDDSKNTSCGRAGVRLYDAFGIGKGEKDRAIDDYYFWKMKPASMVTRYDLAGKGPEELRSLAARMVFLSIAADGTLVALKAKYGLTHDPVAKSTFLSRTKSAKPAK